MTTKLMDGLTGKQQAFCYEYLKCSSNGTKAAIAAGYSAKSASEQAYDLLRKPQIRDAINALLEVKGYTPEFCRNRMGDYALGDITDFEPWLKGEKTLSELREMGVDTFLVRKVKVTNVTVGRDDDGPIYGEKREIELHDAQKATETLCKMLGLFGEKADAQPDQYAGLEVVRRTVIDEYRQHAGESVDLGVAGLEPLPRRIFDADDNGGDGHGGKRSDG